MNFNGRMVFPLLLLASGCTWPIVRFRTAMGLFAMVYLGVGIVITAWRLKADERLVLTAALPSEPMRRAGVMPRHRAGGVGPLALSSRPIPMYSVPPCA